MISNPDLAREVDILMRDIIERISESTAKIKQHCSPEESAAYTRATGHVVGPIVFETMEPLYEIHPELKPTGWDDDDVNEIATR